MRPIARILVVTSALLCSSPLLAEELTVSDLKAFDAKMTAASERCDIDTVVSRIAELAVISGTGFAQGDMRMYRANKAQYRELLTRLCATGRQWSSVQTNEKISFERDQAIMTADVTETAVLNGREITTKVRQRATVELIDGKLMLTQLHSNVIE